MTNLVRLWNAMPVFISHSQEKERKVFIKSAQTLTFKITVKQYQVLFVLYIITFQRIAEETIHRCHSLLFVGVGTQDLETAYSVE